MSPFYVFSESRRTVTSSYFINKFIYERGDTVETPIKISHFNTDFSLVQLYDPYKSKILRNVLWVTLYVGIVRFCILHLGR